MRKITKLISRIIISTLTLIIVGIFGFYFWLNHRLDKVIDRKQYDSLVETIKTSQDLPVKFYSAYQQVTEYDGKSTTNKYLFYKTIAILSFDNGREIKNPCPCADANFGHEYNSLDTWTVSLALDKDVSPKKCLDYYLSNIDFLFSVKGVQNASKFYYHKELNQLSDDEMIELSVMTLNPSYFNKVKQPEKLKLKVLEMKSSIKNRGDEW